MAYVEDPTVEPLEGIACVFSYSIPKVSLTISPKKKSERFTSDEIANTHYLNKQFLHVK